MDSKKDRKKKIAGITENIVLYVYSLIWVIFNCSRLSNDSFWEDEGFTIWLSRMSIPDMLHATGEDVHPPLYYIFVKFFVTVFGESPLTLRITSFMAYTAIVIIALTIIRKFWSAGGAILMITLLSVLHNASVFVTEARMYELAMLLILCAYLSLLHIMKDAGPVHFIIYGLSVAGAAYTHYYALVTVAIMSGLLFIYALALNRKLIKGVLITEALAVLSYSPWLIVLYRTFRNYKDDYWIQTIPSFGKCMRELYRSNIRLEWTMLIITVLAMTLVLVAYYGKGRVATVMEKVTETEAETGVVYWLYIGVLSVVGTAVAGITVSLIFRPLFYERYMYPAAVIAWVILIYCLRRIRFGQIAAYVLALFLFIGCNRSVMFRVDTENEWAKATGETIGRITDSTDASVPVMYSSEVTTEKLLGYYLPGHPAIMCDDPEENKTDDPGDEVIVISSPSGDVAVIDGLEGRGYETILMIQDTVIGQTNADVRIMRYVD